MRIPNLPGCSHGCSHDENKVESPRTSVHIPRDSKINGYLDKMSKQYPNIPKWEFLEEIVKKQPVSEEGQARTAYTDFIKTVCHLFPERKNEIFKNLETLRPLIFKQILKIRNDQTASESLPDSYYEELKKL